MKNHLLKYVLCCLLAINLGSYHAVAQDSAKDKALIVKENRLSKGASLAIDNLFRVSLNAPKLRYVSEGRRARTPLDYRSFVKKNQRKLNLWLKDYEEAFKEVEAHLQAIGRSSYELGSLNELSNQKKIIQNEIQTFRILNHLRVASIQGLAVLIASKSRLHQVNTLHSSSFERVIEREQKELFLKGYFSILGRVGVIEQDLKLTLRRLEKMRTANLLNPVQIELISQVVVAEQAAAKTVRQDNKNIEENKLFQKLSSKDREEIKKFGRKLKQKIKGLSFLYNPESPDGAWQKTAVILSNLTWGLPQTLLGLLWTLADALIYPFVSTNSTEPFLQVSENGYQIRVSSCLFSYFPGAMSLGLFEIVSCNIGHLPKAFSYHEAGHAKQSAILGPFYLVAVAISYISVGGHGGFIESWAWEWAVDDD